MSDASARAVAVAVALLPLVCWPGLDRPFSFPKLWFVAAIDLLIAASWLWRRPASLATPPWPWLALLVAVSLAAVTGPHVSLYALLVFAVPLPLAAAGAAGWLRAICMGSGVEAAIALLQYAGHDPLRWLGWQPEVFAGPRMAVYGTLGNPDFVAAWLTATLPLCAALRGPLRIALVLLHLAAIFSTGSRVFVLALPLVMLATALQARRLPKWWLIGVPVAGALLLVSPARSLATTVQGRLYLAQVTASHLHEVPVAGYGPGSFEWKFAGWQGTWVRAHPDAARFAGAVDHAHNDFLEFWVEYGPLGLAAFVALAAWLLACAWRGPEGVFAALLALLVVALVDFPFHRPAEWTLFIVLASLTRRRLS